jgi:hypothetical protein
MIIINNLEDYYSTDIIVWNGIVTTFHFVKHLIREDDSLRLAKEEEKKKYLEINK